MFSVIVSMELNKTRFYFINLLIQEAIHVACSDMNM